MAKRKRSDHELAEEIANRISRNPTPGAEARELLQRAYDASDGSLRSHYLVRAQRAIAQLNPARQGRLIRELQGHVLALQGRGDDSRIAHVTPGEYVIPRELQSPELLRLIVAEALRQGIDPNSLFVGSNRNAVNPNTGHIEFDEDELEDQAPASDDTPASDVAPSPPPAPITPSNNLRDVADQIVNHINSQEGATTPQANACQLVPPGAQFKTAKGITPLFQPHMAEKLTTAIQSLNKQGIVPVMTGGYRSQQAQDNLRTQPSELMAKPAKISAHGIGLGVDFGPNSNSANIGAIRNAMAAAGLNNGASFKDNPDPDHHFTPDAPRKQTPAMVKACADAYAKLMQEDQE